MKLDIDGVHNFENKGITKYLTKKVDALEKYIPRHARKSAHAEAKIKEEKIKDKRSYSCEVIVTLPNDKLTAKETTMNMFAAVDIVEEKLKVQLRKYKQLHTNRRRNPFKKLIRRLRTSE
jgi:putative sigma-54 modulation protein